MRVKSDDKSEQDAIDAEVLHYLKTGHPDAADRLIEVFGDRLYGLAVRILGSAEDAEEVVQETFLRVWKKWPTFKGKSKFSSWIYRVAANQAYMALRKLRRTSTQVSFDQAGPGDGQSAEATVSRALSRALIVQALTPDEALEQREMLAIIQEAIDSLSPIYRTAYMLKEIEGLSLKEIAAVMEISEPAVKTRVHRARLELRKKLRPVIS